MRWTSGVLLSLLFVASGCLRPGFEASEQGPVTLELFVYGSGRVVDAAHGIDCAGECVYELERNTVVSLTATSADTAFGKWEGGCGGTTPSCDLELAASFAVGARFGFRLEVVPGPSGEGLVTSDLPGIQCGDECIGVFNPGTKVLLTASVAAGTTFRGWGTPSCTTSAPCAVTLDAHQVVAPVFFGGSRLWSRAWGSSDGTEGPGSHDYGYAVKVDGGGAVFVAGAFRNTVDFGGTSETSVGGSDQYVAQLDADGAVQQVLVGGQSGNDAVLGLAVEGNSLYAAGYVTDPALGDLDATVERVAPQAEAWSQTVATTGNDFAIGVLPDAKGTVTVTGQTNGRALVTDFAKAGGGAGINRTVGGGNDTAWSASRDGGGNQVVVGEFDGQLTVITGNTMFATGVDAFIAKYDETGAPVFVRQLTGPGNDIAYSVTTVGADFVVVGTFSGTVDFGGQLRSAAAGNDVFAARYDALGALQWVTTFGGGLDEEAFAVAATPDGGVVLTGYYQSADIDFGYGALPMGGASDVFAVKLGADGQHLWSYGYGGAGEEVGYAVAVGADGQPVIAGAFQQNIVVGGQALNSAGGYDVLVIRSGR